MQLQQQQYANQVEVEDNHVNEELFMTDHDMNKQENANGRKFFAYLTVVETNRSKVVKAQIDSASTCNTVPVNILYQRFPNIKIEKTEAAIQTYGDQRIKPKGKVTFCCERKGRLHLLDILVVNVPRGKPPLLSGRDAIIKMCIISKSRMNSSIIRIQSAMPKVQHATSRVKKVCVKEPNP